MMKYNKLQIINYKQIQNLRSKTFANWIIENYLEIVPLLDSFLQGKRDPAGAVRNWKLEIPRPRRGFTIIEMVVVIGIFTMMTLLYTANFKGFQQGLAVEGDADEISAAIRQMQIWALTGELIGGVRPDGGYGFTTNAPCTTGTCSYKLFGDVCNISTHVYESGCDLLIETETLNSVVNVSAAAPASPLSIVFGVPTSTPYVNGNASQNASVTLTHRGNPSKTKTVSVDGVSGQVMVQ